jgi:hypothetical protein
MSSLKKRLAALRERYPYQFARLFEFGLSVEPGWCSDIEAACAQVDEVLAGVSKENFSWIQIKEKMGTLRMYWDRRWTSERWSYAEEWLLRHEPEWVFPDTPGGFVVPQDPSFDSSKETFDDYLSSERAKVWDARFMVPNPKMDRSTWTRNYGISRVLNSVDFDERLSQKDCERAMNAVANALLVPEESTRAIEDIIRRTEEATAKRCQMCGEPGTLVQHPGGWLGTYCLTHASREISYDDY